MAGATKTFFGFTVFSGHARQTQVRRLSHSPDAILPRVLALSGANNKTSAQSRSLKKLGKHLLGQKYVKKDSMHMARFLFCQNLTRFSSEI